MEHGWKDQDVTMCFETDAHEISNESGYRDDNRTYRHYG